ncbi:histidine kinase dimerization/phospho-acceptor domain-containing protein [Hyalangium rubrum]|uniref:histidine kinase n=1 Tax=Hyalangium rubrum TaxID=3103134 RepID=A0ABU5HII8_9BACT|nr:histidine kinase dimerization/phospho-acceptor domain-containing protein [Hyalangium sp. s54d21]MDY7232633.1 histidine kinase dimerization/phospho-acceptor domain-containing protein [Hyalangium sp. s54d21]
MGTITTGGAMHLLEEATTVVDTAERVASELRYPLTALRLSAEGLLRQLQDTQGDPTEIDAAQSLIHSVERMSRMVQTFLEVQASELT